MKIFQWHVDKKCLEISFNGTSIVIEDIDLNFAEAFAKELKATLIQKATPYVAPDVAPQVTQSKKGVTLKVWKYPAHPDNR